MLPRSITAHKVSVAVKRGFPELAENEEFYMFLSSYVLSWFKALPKEKRCEAPTFVYKRAMATIHQINIFTFTIKFSVKS